MNIISSIPKILLPIPKHEWRTPSQAQKKDTFGNEDKTVFRVKAYLNDGFVIWTGWFDDRDDFDAFLYACANNTLNNQPALWRLCLPNWAPGLFDHLEYSFAADVVSYYSTVGNGSYITPQDWSPINSIQVLGGGGGGGAGRSYNSGGDGGGGGAYVKGINITSVAPKKLINYLIGAGGAAGATNAAVGQNGGDTTWGTNLLRQYQVFADNGGGGGSGTNRRYVGLGGQTRNCQGTIIIEGGDGGGQGYGGGGGGGAAGPNGEGVAGIRAVGGQGGNGGAGDAGRGGVGGAGGPNGRNGSPGTNGTELGGGYGCGGGGGGGGGDNAGAGAKGGNYGAGGGGGGEQAKSGWAQGGAGIQGLMIVTYKPGTAGFFLMFT